MPKHQNFFATNLTSNVLAGATTTPLNSIPTIDCPFWLVFDRTNLNGHAETVYCTSKTATNVNHAALTYAHTTAEEVAQTIVAEEADGMYTDGMPYGMARQAIMNGNFDIWQRGVNFTLADLSGVFEADRWKDYVDKNGGTLPNLVRTRELLTPGDIPGSLFFSRLTTNGAGSSLGVNSEGEYSQKIENGTSKLCGLNKKVTISFYARSSIANKRICPTIRQNYGSGGSPTAQEEIKGTPITLTSSWTKYIVTFTTNTLVGKTFGSNLDDYLNLTFWNMWGATFGNTYVQTGVSAESFVGAGNIDIAQVQLCSGDVALPFQPKSFEEELRACQRYYEKSYDYTVAPGAATLNGGVYFQTPTAGTGSMYAPVHYSVEKRTSVAPTLYDDTGASGKVFKGASGKASAIAGQGSSGFNGGTDDATSSSLLGFSWTASAEL